MEKLLQSKFFTDNSSEYFGALHIFVVDNGVDLPIVNDAFLHVFHNRNSGGSGGFQRGLEEIRAFPVDFTHVIFMDDDVEYGLRCGKAPVIIEGVQVWHETFEKRLTPIIRYYDTRNPLFVNELHHISKPADVILSEWKRAITECHVRQDWLTEYYLIRALNDYLKEIDWLKSIDAGHYHQRLLRRKSNRYKNAFFWRLVQYKFKRRYRLKAE